MGLKKKINVLAVCAAVVVILLALAAPVFVVAAPSPETPVRQCVLGNLIPPVANKSIFLPDCAYFEGTEKETECGCRNINVFIQLLTRSVNFVFVVVGGVALIMFVYGGFVILTAAGGERVKKGKEVLVAAVIGLVVIFSAQLLIKFVLQGMLDKNAVIFEGVKIQLPEIK